MQFLLLVSRIPAFQTWCDFPVRERRRAMADGERFQEVQVHDLTFVVFLLSSSILNLALIIVYFSCTFRYSWISLHLKQRSWYFPGNPVVKTLWRLCVSAAGSMGSILVRELGSLMLQCSQRKSTNQTKETQQKTNTPQKSTPFTRFLSHFIMTFSDSI